MKMRAVLLLAAVPAAFAQACPWGGEEVCTRNCVGKFSSFYGPSEVMRTCTDLCLEKCPPVLDGSVRRRLQNDGITGQCLTTAVMSNSDCCETNTGLLEGMENRIRELESRPAGPGGVLCQLEQITSLETMTTNPDNSYIQWPGLQATFTAKSSNVYQIQYQASLGGKETHVLSRIMLDGEELPSGRSIVGNETYKSNWGQAFVQLEDGEHTVSIEYRGPGAERLNAGGTDWQTRAMSYVAIPNATIHVDYTDNEPWSTNGSNNWTDVPGLADKCVTLESAAVVHAQYYLSGPGCNSHTLSKFFITYPDGNEVEHPGSRSIAGNTKYIYNRGTWVGRLKAGRYCFTVQYRSPGNCQHKGADDNDWHTRGLTIVELPKGSKVLSALEPDDAVTLSNANSWTQWPSLSASFSVDGSSIVHAYYQAAGPAQNSHVLSKMFLDGQEQVQTRSIIGNTSYFLNAGFGAWDLPAGTHSINVQYRTPATVSMNVENTDWQAHALYIWTTPRVGC